MSIVPTNDLNNTRTGVTVTSGEFAGWQILPLEPFDNLVGPLYHRHDENGTTICSFRAENKNTNGLGLVHGGCLLTLADYCMFVTALTKVDCEIVTVSFGSEFLGTAREGDLIEARGEATKVGRSLVFLRGLLTVGGSPILSFSGTVKKVSFQKR